MAGESYTLREVAELLGVSKRTLQRRIQEGAFPGRFLAPGRHGLETRIPAADVERALEELRRGARGAGEAPTAMAPNTSVRMPTVTPARELQESGYGGGIPSALTHADLESLRDAMIAIVREDRESFLCAVREALAARDQEILGLRQQIGAVQAAVERIRRKLKTKRGRGAKQERVVVRTRTREPSKAPASGPITAHEVDSLLREIDELEALMSGLT